MRRLLPERFREPSSPGRTSSTGGPILRSVAIVVLALVALQRPFAQSDDPTVLVAAGDRALAAGEYYRAIEGYRAALDANPNYLEGLIGLADAYYWLDEYDQATIYVGQASRLARSDPRVLNLAGLIAIGMGNLDSAQSYFEHVQQVEPNNVDSSIGRAELALARGQSADAVRSLEQALRLNPDNRKALLSLVLIYEQRGDTVAAERYLDLARSVHRDEPEVYVLAAQYYLRAGRLDLAARAARTAQALAPSNAAALSIRARIAILHGDNSEAATIAEQIITSNRNDVGAWYIRALAKYRLGMLDDAFTSIRTALRLAPDNEIERIWAEWLAMKELPLDDPVRAELASKRADDGAALRQAFRFERAMNSFRRALQLSPLDDSLRRAYADMYRALGYNASYLQELSLLSADGQDTALQRTIEVYTNVLSASVSKGWNVDQFTLERSRTSIGLYLRAGSMRTADAYPGAEDAVLDFITRTVESGDRLDVVDSGVVESYAAAFSRARSQDVRFFIIVDATPLDTMLSLDAAIYVARTGTRATTIHTVRTGPDHAAAAVDAMVSALESAIPVEGKIIQRDRQRVLIDLGARDGVAVDDVFSVVAPSGVMVAAGTATLQYDPATVLGTVTITATDDLVSSGTLEISGFVDTVTTGDLTLHPPPDGGAATGAEASGAGAGRSARSASPDVFPLLYERVRRLR